MRELTLINEYGQEFALNNLDTGFIKKLSGIGFQMDYKYTRSGSAWVSNTQHPKQIPLKGEIVNAASDPYLTERELLNFIRRTKRAKVRYKTSAGTWYKDVDVVQYDKSEISKGALHCPIVFMPKTLWYSSTSVIVSFEVGTGGIRYSYRLPARINDFVSGYAEIVNDGSEGADFSVEFYGGITNPSIFVQQDGEEYARVDLTASATSEQKVLYQSKDGDGEHFAFLGNAEDIDAFKQTRKSDNLTNLVTGLDIANENFFKLPVGTSRIFITAESAITNPIIINTFKYYRAV